MGWLRAILQPQEHLRASAKRAIAEAEGHRRELRDIVAADRQVADEAARSAQRATGNVLEPLAFPPGRRDR